MIRQAPQEMSELTETLKNFLDRVMEDTRLKKEKKERIIWKDEYN